MEHKTATASASLKKHFLGSFSVAASQRRTSPRTIREGGAYLFDAGGRVGHADIIDVSSFGLRLSQASAHCYDRVKYVLLMHSGVAHQVELVWEHDGQAGFRVSRLNMRGPALDSGMEDLRAIWRRRRV